MDIKFLSALSKTLREAHDPKDLAQSFSENQLQCKNWLVTELNKVHKPSNILILGSWYATPFLMAYPDAKITCVDLDLQVTITGQKLADNLGVNATFIHGNAAKFDMRGYDTVINTSCEHMPDLEYKEGYPIYALQSNNYYGIEGHVNCKDSLVDFIESTNLHQIYSGELERDKYTRYMVIGTL